jgi:hypothetical protein
MQNIQKLNSKDLLARTLNLVAEERRVIISLIEHLEEIQSRRLHNEMGFSSLWEFCTRYLGLSEGAAQRRISAMRLTRDVPEAKAAIQSGRLSLSNAAKVQTFRQAQRKKGIAGSDPHKLIKTVENLSQRECEAKLFELSPEALPRERERIVSASQDRELRLVISAELHEKLERLKGLIAHAKPDASYAELLEYLVDQTLPRVERKKGIVLKNSTSTEGESAHVSPSTTKTSDQADQNSPVTAAAAVTKAAMAQALPAGKRVPLPAILKRKVFARSGGRCQYVHEGRRCNSAYQLEIDHIRPLAYGGGHELEQLRVLCKSHNLQQFQVWKKRGASKHNSLSNHE